MISLFLLLLMILVSCKSYALLGGINRRRSSQYGTIRLPASSFLIQTSDSWAILSGIAVSSSIGLQLEAKTKTGRSLSSPVCAMLISSLLTNFGLLPSDAPLVPQLQSFIVNLATPLLLLSADLKEVKDRTGSLLKSFLVAALGTVLGSLVAFSLCSASFQSTPMLQMEGWKIAGALVAKNVGGGLNFMSVANSLQTSSLVIAMGLAVDNIAGLLYFPFLSWVGTRYNEMNKMNVDLSLSSSASKTPAVEISVESLLYALAVSLVTVSISSHLAPLLHCPSILITTLLSVLIATIFSRNVAVLVSSGETLGKLLLLLFFGSVGISGGKVLGILSSSSILPLLSFNLILYAVHMMVVLIVGSRLSLSLPDLLLGSNASIGNAATASAFASAMKWTNKMMPAVLVGTLGNVIGTAIGLILASHVFKTF